MSLRYEPSSEPPHISANAYTCAQVVEVLRTELSEKHHTRLEQSTRVSTYNAYTTRVSTYNAYTTRVSTYDADTHAQVVEVLRTELSEKHHTRLEQIIIYLIAVEVVFELMHFII